MANQMYGLGLQSIGSALVDLTSSGATIKALLATTAYTPSINVDQFVSDIPGGAIIARSPSFSSKTISLGVFNAATVTFASVAGGSTGTYLVIYKDTGSDSTSVLLAIIDVATGLPISTNGGDITVTWDTGSNKIFKL